MNQRIAGGLAVLAVVAGAIWRLGSQDRARGSEAPPLTGETLAYVTVPNPFSEHEQIGVRAFDAKCDECHGENAAGRDGVAPPLVHKIYEPKHHGDQAFHLAVMNRVRAHHRPFGSMPTVDGLTPADIDAIIANVRALQRANGIN
jgi:mono/diheme cytochrome c family protein